MARAQRGEVQHQPHAEQAERRADGAQIGIGMHQHGSILGEDAGPQPGPQHHQQAQHGQDGGGQPRARPRHLARAHHLAGAHGHAHHGHGRHPHAKGNRNQQKLQPLANAIAGQGIGPQPCDHAGQHQSGQRGLHRRDAGQGADAQDVLEHGPRQARTAPAQQQPVLPVQQVPAQHHNGHGHGDDVAQCHTGHAPARCRPQPQAERPAHHDLQQRHPKQHGRRPLHVARAAHHRGQRIAQPHQHRPAEQHRAKARGGLQHLAPPTQPAVEDAAAQHQQQ